MPVVGRTGSQRDRRTGRFDAISDDDNDATDDDHPRRPDDLANVGKWDLLDISNKEDLGVSVHTGGRPIQTLYDFRNAIRAARGPKSTFVAPVCALAPWSSAAASASSAVFGPPAEPQRVFHPVDDAHDRRVEALLEADSPI